MQSTFHPQNTVRHLHLLSFTSISHGGIKESRVISGCSLLLEEERSYLDSYVFLTNYNREASCGGKQPKYFGGEINN